MRILHIYKSFYPDSRGGVERCIADLLENAIPGDQHDIFTLSQEPRDLFIWSGDAKVYQGRQSFNIFSTPISFSAHCLFKDLINQYDVLHYHFPWPYADLLNLFYRPRLKPYVVTYHLDVVRQKSLMWLYAPLMKNFLSNATKIVVTSKAYLNSSPYLQPYLDKTQIIPLGMKKEPIQIDVAKKQKWQSQLPKDFFIFVGSFRHYKGLDVLVKSLVGTPHQLVIIGDGPTRHELVALARKLKVLDQIYFLGALEDDDKWVVMSLALALVLPSSNRAESFGMVLLEGAKMGLALITTQLENGSLEVNLNRQTGLVVEPGNPAALKDAMTALSADLNSAKIMGQAAQDHIRDKFDMACISREYSRLYHDILS